jgi:hypothetical protein
MAEIWEEVLGRVKYPDETGLVFDGTPYDEVAEFLCVLANKDDSPDERREMAVATLAELKRRWVERQRRVPQAARNVAAS